MSDFPQHAPADIRDLVRDLAKLLCVNERVLWSTRCAERLQRFGEARFEAGEHHAHARTTVLSREP